MGAGKNDAATALEVMRQWNWLGGYPDGNVWPVSLELSRVINRLAMEGIARPQDAVLSLLCQGDLFATGNYQWQKYQGGNHFRFNGPCAPIKPKQWQDLADLIEWERLERDKTGGECGLDNVELVKLGMEKRFPYDWAFTHNRFATSLCNTDALWPNDPAYLEESYSAWAIEVLPTRLDHDLLESDPEPVAPAPNKGGAPRKWDWDGALLHLAALAHHGANGLLRLDGGDPNQSDIARHLADWFVGTCGKSPEDSQLRD